MACKAHLASQSHIIAQLGAARDARLGYNQTVFTGGHIVADLNQIIDFSALTDMSGAQSTSVDGYVCPNFRIVFNHYISDLRYFQVLSGFLYVAKTV